LGNPNSSSLGLFKNFCLVDLQLKAASTDQHVSRIGRFLSHIGKEPQDVEYEDIQSFLAELQSHPENILKYDVEVIKPRTYCNWLKSFRRYFRDFLHKGELVKSFKFPSIGFEFPSVPSTEDLRKAYSVLKKDVERAVFLMYATTSLRHRALLDLKIADVDFATRCVMPDNNGSRTKKTNFSYYNDEAKAVLDKYLATRTDLNPESKLFDFTTANLKRMFLKIKRRSGIHLSPKSLRAWFCSEMAPKIGDAYTDFFCGRTPKSVLGQHYLDYSLQKTKQIYDSANLRVLETS